jgi:homoserine kinase type II
MPVADKTGATLTTLKGKPTALVSRLQGQSVLFPTLEQCAAVGQVLAQLHQLTQSYAGHAENGRGAAWRRDTALKLIPKVDAEARALIETELQAQAGVDLASLPQGVIHADLFKDNVLFVDQRLSGVIDFYYACNDALVYDLAVTLNDWCAEPDGHLHPEHSQALLAAYRDQREPSAAERAAWPLVLRAAAFRFYLSRLYDWTFPREGDLVHIKDPEPYRRILVHHREKVAAL